MKVLTMNEWLTKFDEDIELYIMLNHKFASIAEATAIIVGMYDEYKSNALDSGIDWVGND